MLKNEIAVVDQVGLLNPGDNLFARITNTRRKVLKVEKNNGADRYSVTLYPNGTIVETKTTKRR